MAAYRDNLDMVKFFVENGCDINLKNKSGFTPLHIACENGNKPIVSYLLQKNANMYIEDNNERIPIFIAIVNKHCHIVKSFLENRYNINYLSSNEITCTHVSIYSCNFNIAELLIKNNADINLFDSEGLNMLHVAIIFNNIEIVKLLVDNGININAQTTDDFQTPLHLSIRGKRNNITEYLLTKNPDLEIKNKYNETAIEIAMNYHNIDVIMMIHKHLNKEINLNDIYQKYPFHIKSLKNLKEIPNVEHISIDYSFCLVTKENENQKIK
jgi:ankyrin repeat protein